MEYERMNESEAKDALKWKLNKKMLKRMGIKN
jgi:hypothetical protein